MKPRFWQVIICILIGIILVAGGVFGLYAGVRNARAVVKLGDVTVDSGTVTYLTALYKQDYINALIEDGVEASDTEEFWHSEKSEGVRYGELFEAELEIYITGLVADAYLYVTHHGYTAEDKISVAEKSNNIVRDYAHGSVDEFNRVAEAHGFDYSDFQNANALIFKAQRARALLPDTLGHEEYEAELEAAKERVVFNRYYKTIDILAVPKINDYYVK